MNKIEIIDDTIDWYSSHPRSLLPGTNTCLYKGSDGKECAFQRVVENDLSICEGKAAFVLARDKAVTFKPGYEGHDEDFWHEIQRLHDNQYYWEGQTFTELGIKKVKELKELYKN